MLKLVLQCWYFCTWRPNLFKCHTSGIFDQLWGLSYENQQNSEMWVDWMTYTLFQRISAWVKWKTTMIWWEKCANKIVWPLICFVYRNSSINKLYRVNHECYSIKKCLFMIVDTIFTLYICIEFLFTCSWDNVPTFYPTFMVVVQGIHT